MLRADLPSNAEFDALPFASEAGILQKAIFNSANFSMIATDNAGVIQLFNVGAERMLGYAAAEVVNRITPAELHDPQEVIARAAAISIAFETEIKPGFEALVYKAARGIEDIYTLTKIRKDGTRFPAMVSVTALRDTRGAIIGYLLIGTDNTARKLVDDALRKSEAQLHAIVENLAEGVIVTDLNGTILHSNAAAEALHGVANSGDFPHRLSELVDAFKLSTRDGKLLSRDEWPTARILHGEKLRGFEARIKRIGTDWRRVFAYGGTLVYETGGQPMMAVFTIIDITEAEADAELIRQLNRDLEQRVSERTSQLVLANQELESFSYSVSHDLRAPLRAIDGFSHALLEDQADQLNDEAKGHLGRIRAATRKMGQLIDDLLNLSRMSCTPLLRDTVDLSRIAHEIANEMKAGEPARDVEFIIADGLVAQTDPRLLRIVLENLIGNAWKFTGQRPHARIEFGCCGDEPDKAFFVRDNGAGFDMKYAQKLFGAFQRMHEAVNFPGTGIGLATVRRIVERQGGRVWAESEFEIGSTFHFTLSTNQ